jgi:hypothetical protein
VVSPFTRLARAHAFAVATDTLIAMALAGSLFFSIPTGEARGRVTLYLALTMAPFAVVSPLIGPAIDRARGGRRGMVMRTPVRDMVPLFGNRFLYPQESNEYRLPFVGRQPTRRLVYVIVQGHRG